LKPRRVDIIWRCAPIRARGATAESAFTMNRLVKLFLATGLVGLLATAGAAGGGARRPAPAPSAPAAPVVVEYRTYCESWVARAAPSAPDTRPVVWVVDGAGDLRGCSNALTTANQMAGNTAEIVVFQWSHGYRRLLADQTDWAHAKAHGEKLAAAIRERKAREPGRRVVLVAHSAGCAVALVASECLPPDTIDRTVLLAPSVSTGYDLRPALWTAKEGVDVFCSRKDWVALGFVVRVVGTTDTGSGPAAGRLGFRPRGAAATDPVVSAKLRQHFWTAEQKWTGHTGGHHGMHSPAFLHAYVFPLIGAPVR
jgi:hypothetical protein